MSIFLRLLILAASAGLALAAPSSQVVAVDWSTPGSVVLFEPNQGQADPRVHHLARTPAGVVYFTGEDLVLHRTGSNHLLRFEFLHTTSTGSTAGRTWRAAEAAAGTISYMVGRNPREWAQNVPRYRRLERKNLYDGIDLIYYGDRAGNLEYDLVLLPDVSPAAIRLRVHGARRLAIDADGALAIHPQQGPTVWHRRPYLYQTTPDGSRREVSGRFVLRSATDVGFEAGAHDPSLPLSIDPVIDGAAYLGGRGDDRVVGRTQFGTIGTTSSIDFPGQASRRRGRDVFIQIGQTTRIFGGSGDDEARATSEGFSSGVSVGGVTDSPDLPTTFTQGGQIVRGWQPEFAGGATDGFVASFSRLNSFAPSIISYVGGPGDDQVTAMPPFNFATALVGTTTARGFGPSQGARTPLLVGPGGGIDGFLVQFSSASLVSLTYFGGSEDDVPLGVVRDLFSPSLYIAGETKSADFPTPGRTQERRGPSDAFILSVDATASGLEVRSGALYGGSGADRATAVALARDSGVWIAGVTGSQDLPLENPVQSSFAGGDTDAFVARLSRDFSVLRRASYLGGTGTDEATSIASATRGGDFAVGGWTNSRDFPVRNAAQADFAGGDDDGFAAHYFAGGDPVHVTYYGGSGSDRVLGLAIADAPVVTFWGQTTSPALPGVTATDRAAAGGMDGFVASSSVNTFSAPSLLGARGVRGRSFVYSSVPASSESVPPQVTVQSADPGAVLVAAQAEDEGRPSVEVSGTQATFYIDCRGDRPSAVVVSAPGFAERTFPVSCNTSQLAIRFLVGASSTVTPPLRVGLGQQNFRVSAALQVLEPATNLWLPGYLPQPGQDPPRVSVASTNGSVLRPDSATWEVRSEFDDRGVSVRTFDFGEANLTFDSNFPLSIASANVTVFPSINAPASVNIPAGFQAVLNVSTPSPGPILVTSSDPSKLLISTSPTRRGTASAIVDLPSFNGLFAQALASEGEVTVRIDAPNLPPVNIVARLREPLASFGPGTLQRIEAGTGLFVFMAADTFGLFLNPDHEPLSISWESDNQAVVPNPAGPVRVQPGQNALLFLPLTVAGPGVATIRLTAANIPIDPGGSTAEVIAGPRGLRLEPVDVVKDSTASMLITFPSRVAAPTPVTVRSDNPDVVQVSATAQSPGAGEVTVNTVPNTNLASVIVRGMATEGRARITASSPGLEPASAFVHIGVPGIGWNLDTLTMDRSPEPLQLVSLLYQFTLDPATLAPVRRGVPPNSPPTIQSSNPNVVTVVRTSLGSSLTILALEAKALGEAVLSIDQPPGFSAPAGRARLTVRVRQPRLTFSGPVSLGKDLMRAVAVSGVPRSATEEMTITSSDPSRLRVSANDTTEGSASITVRPNGGSHVFYIHALAGEGAAQVSASLPGFLPAEMTVRLRPAYLNVLADSGEDSGTLRPDGVFATTTVSPPVPLSIVMNGFDDSSGFLRTGAAPIELRLLSSRPGVGAGVVTKRIEPGQPGLARGAGEFRPSGAGETEISVAPPAGFVAPPPSAPRARFAVTAPGFEPSNRVIPKDTAVTTWARLPRHVRFNVATTVTITSPDPARVLLGTDARITRMIAAGQDAAEFPIQAIGDSGMVPLTISAPGLVDTAMNIYLTRLQGQFTSRGNVALTVSQGRQTGTVSLTEVPVRPLPATPAALVGQNALRPGLRITGRIVSSDPSVVRVDNAEVTFADATFNGSFTYTPLTPGTATLSLELPAGVAVEPVRGRITVTVQ